MDHPEPSGPTADSADYARTELDALRAGIDEVDQRLVDALLERKRLVDRVAALKRAHNLPVYHPAREEDLIFRRRSQATEIGLDPNLVEDLFDA